MIGAWDLALWLRPELVAFGAPPLPDAWELWGGPAVLLGVVFACTTIGLSVADLLQPAAYRAAAVASAPSHTDLGETAESGGGRVAPSGRRMLGMVPVVLRNGLASAAMIYVAWNVRLAVHPGSLSTGAWSLLARPATLEPPWDYLEMCWSVVPIDG